MVAFPGSLTFLIPVYCRLNSAYRATDSIVSQLNLIPANAVSVWVNDDCSPSFSEDEFFEKFRSFLKYPNVRVSRNQTNMGMSENIFYMSNASRTRYCTVLTDDDFLELGCLPEIMETVSFAENYQIKTIFTPRYSYLENKSLYCIACMPFKEPIKLIGSSPFNALKYMDSGFILTGMIYSTSLSFKLWKENINNGYFPIINYGESLLSSPSLFINKKWFYHTVLNETHWHKWGKTKLDQEVRLYTDYLLAQTIVFSQILESCPRDLSLRIKIICQYVKIQYKYSRFIVDNLPIHRVIKVFNTSKMNPLLQVCCLVRPFVNSCRQRISSVAKTILSN